MLQKHVHFDGNLLTKQLGKSFYRLLHVRPKLKMTLIQHIYHT